MLVHVQWLTSSGRAIRECNPKPHTTLNDKQLSRSDHQANRQDACDQLIYSRRNKSPALTSHIPFARPTCPFAAGSRSRRRCYRTPSYPSRYSRCTYELRSPRASSGRRCLPSTSARQRNPLCSQTGVGPLGAMLVASETYALLG